MIYNVRLNYLLSLTSASRECSGLFQYQFIIELNIEEYDWNRIWIGRRHCESAFVRLQRDVSTEFPRWADSRQLTILEISRYSTTKRRRATIDAFDLSIRYIAEMRVDIFAMITNNGQRSWVKHHNCCIVTSKKIVRFSSHCQTWYFR